MTDYPPCLGLLQGKCPDTYPAWIPCFQAVYFLKMPWKHISVHILTFQWLGAIQQSEGDREKSVCPSLNMRENIWAVHNFLHERINQASVHSSALTSKTALKFARTDHIPSWHKLVWHYWLQ